MNDNSDNEPQVIEAYRQHASRYDRAVKLFDVFAWMGFNLSAWRKQAISALALTAGDTVVDIGCGTGLNFPLLQQAVTSRGQIIGVDLSDAMLAQARQRVEANRWANVQLVCADAAQYQFPPHVSGVLATYALILVPDCGRVVTHACEALAPGGRLVVLDMAWPRYCPLWWRHVLFFLRSYGVTADTLRRRPWETIQRNMEELFPDFSRQRFWFDFFYLAHGTAPNTN